MSFPGELRYTKDHEWIRVETDGKTATVGITDFAQHELGDIVYVDLQPVGTELAREQPFGTVEAVKTVSDLFMPVSGTIVAVNSDLDARPELVNEDAYGQGWMVRVEMSNPGEVDGLLTAEQYEALAG